MSDERAQMCQSCKGTGQTGGMGYNLCGLCGGSGTYEYPPGFKFAEPQLDVFDAAARHSDPETSKRAAEMDPTEWELHVLRALEKLGGSGTIKAVAQRIDPTLETTISPRFRPLARKGLIVDTDEKIVSGTGRAAILWRITYAGLQRIGVAR